MDSAALETVQAWLREAPQIAVLTGAGVSAESGVPTFRDAQTGYWAQFRPEDMATEEGFRAQPALVWRWYQHRRQLLQGVQPNAAHLALAAFAQQHPGRLTLITQNVDGLHQRAGSADVLCLHGDLMEDRFLDLPRPCCHPDTVEAGDPPHCPRCGNLLRPGVVWFGEALPLGHAGGRPARRPPLCADAGGGYRWCRVPGGRPGPPGARCRCQGGHRQPPCQRAGPRGPCCAAGHGGAIAAAVVGA
jgi:NAD-dependent SIR2 family protein deacetylase